MQLQRIDRSICQCSEMGQVHGKPYSSGYRRGASQSNHYISIFHPPNKWYISVGAEDLPFPDEHGGICSFGGSIHGDNCCVYDHGQDVMFMVFRDGWMFNTPWLGFWALGVVETHPCLHHVGLESHYQRCSELWTQMQHAHREMILWKKILWLDGWWYCWPSE